MARGTQPPRWLEAARLRGRQETGDTWLSRALARAGVLPLAEAEQAIRLGRVKVDGAVAHEPRSPVRPGARVWLDGAPVSLDFRTRVLAFHKPAGLVTHGSDPEGIGTVFEGLARVLPPQLQGFGWHAVGRLDRDTTGLLLFTNDERFVAHATRPETHLPKRYLATVGADVTAAALEALRAGPTLHDGPTRPAEARARGPRQVELTLTQGRYHQVKRMLQAVGLATLALHREAIGGVGCDVPVGGCRELTDEEVRSALRYAPR
jgi:23S rRNA pseudouridine2605 synthase/16S rRNA pseudouridine516 synthase